MRNRSFIIDTLLYPEITKHYTADLVVMNVVRLRPDDPQIFHPSMECARKMIAGMKPKAAVLTHFGMTVLNAKP